MRRRLLAAFIAGAGFVATSGAQAPADVPPVAFAPFPSSKIATPWSDATVAFDTWPDNLPESLRGRSRAEVQRRWPRWIRERDVEIRARVAEGEEDSLVNLWLYGTSFTELPRAVEPEMSRSDRLTPRAIVAGRLEDLIDGAARPGSNDRLQFAREVLQRHGLSPSSVEDRERIRRFLAQRRARMIAEFEEYDRGLRSAGQADVGELLSLHAILFRERGLSTDTSVLITFAVDQALAALASSGAVVPGALRHVGIVGPGLELTNKADGQDFYPQQTLQPFAFLDAAYRRGLADPLRLRVTAFDVSPRVNRHLETARARAQSGQPYTLHLPLSADEAWQPELVAFRNGFGASIGDDAGAPAVPATAGALTVRAVHVRPAAVLAIHPADLNVIVERPAPLHPDDRFDLIVATNVLVYYGRFEQALALTNLAAMLRPGGILLTNSAVFPVPPFKPSAQQLRVVYSDRQYDHLFWYQRQ